MGLIRGRGDLRRRATGLGVCPRQQISDGSVSSVDTLSGVNKLRSGGLHALPHSTSQGQMTADVARLLLSGEEVWIIHLRPPLLPLQILDTRRPRRHLRHQSGRLPRPLDPTTGARQLARSLRLLCSHPRTQNLNRGPPPYDLSSPAFRQILRMSSSTTVVEYPHPVGACFTGGR
jgi:hypothetical protein